jgi:hypothetical protein
MIGQTLLEQSERQMYLYMTMVWKVSMRPSCAVSSIAHGRLVRHAPDTLFRDSSTEAASPNNRHPSYGIRDLALDLGRLATPTFHHPNQLTPVTPPHNSSGSNPRKRSFAVYETQELDADDADVHLQFVSMSTVKGEDGHASTLVRANYGFAIKLYESVHRSPSEEAVC